MHSWKKAQFFSVVSFVTALALAPFAIAAQNPALNPAASPTGSAEAKSAAESPAAGTMDAPFHEDFASLVPAKGDLKLELAVLGEIDDKPGLPYTRERWHLLWRAGDPIDVYILKPRGVEKPPVILYLYSYPQDTDRFKTDSWGGYTTGNGFAAVGFVSANTGHRLEHRPPREDFFTELPESLGATVHDVQMILNYLESRKEFDMTRVGMFGQGSGGSIAILASAADPRIKALDVLTPWGDWPAFLKTSSFVPTEDRVPVTAPDFLAKVAPLEPLHWLPKVKARSVRIQDVRRDGHMPDEAQEHMEAVAPETVIEINQFGDGGALVPAAANGRLLDWIKNQLKLDAKPQVAEEKSQRVHFFPPKLETNPLGTPH